MARIKIPGNAVENPSANNINEATMVSITTSAAVTLTLKTAGAATTKGTLRIAQGATVLLEKDPTDEITCGTCFATKIAYNV